MIHKMEMKTGNKEIIMEFFDEESGQSINFQIPEAYKRVAVNCSGGADSSILLLLTAHYLKETGRENDVKLSVLTCSNDLKGRWNGRKAADVIDYVIRKTGYTNFDMHYTYYRDTQDEKYFHMVESELFSQKRVDFIASGITSNPPEGVMVEKANGEIRDMWEGRLPDRDGTIKTELNVSGIMAFYMPFTNVDKRMVASLYKQLDAEDLLDRTRSCEAIPDAGNYDENFDKEPCGKCWWCCERKWAFGKF